MIETGLKNSQAIEVEGSIYCCLGFSCDNDCLMCVADVSEEHGNMPTAEMIRYIDRLAGNKNLAIQISGGEPTLRNDFLYLMEYISIRAPNITKVLLSNGRTFSNRDFTEKVARYPPASVLIPLHAHDPEIHDAITRRSGSFHETVLGINNLFDYNIGVIVKIIVNKQNYFAVPDFVRFVAQTFPDVKLIGIDTMDLWGAAATNKEIVKVKHTESAPYIEKGIEIALEHGLNVTIMYLPFCTINQKYWQYIRPDMSISMYKAPEEERMKENICKERGTVEACGACKCLGRCPGTWHSYFKEFGYSELKPML